MLDAFCDTASMVKTRVLKAALPWVSQSLSLRRVKHLKLPSGAAGSCRKCLCSAPSTGAGGNFRLRNSDFVMADLAPRVFFPKLLFHHVIAGIRRDANPGSKGGS